MHYFIKPFNSEGVRTYSSSVVAVVTCRGVV